MLPSLDVEAEVLLNKLTAGPASVLTVEATDLDCARAGWKRMTGTLNMSREMGGETYVFVLE